MGKVMFMRKGETHTDPREKLPDGYTRLKYIESTGTQYIDMVSNNSTKSKYVCDIEFISVYNDDYDWFIGNRQATTNWLMGYYNGQACYWAGGYVYAGPLAVGQRTILTVDFKDKIFSSSVGSSVSISTTTPSTYPPRLFIGNLDSFKKSPKCRTYRVQKYEDSILSVDIVPCVDPNGNIGLFDLVTKTFLGNKGTGVFVGSEVS